MKNPKHKGTEFSNISRVWEQNEKENRRGEAIHESGNEFSNVSQVWEENEKKKAGQKESATEKSEGETENR